MIYCPFCQGQGIIYKARIITNNTEIFICDECDTMWLNSSIKEDDCINFQEYMGNLGFKPLWSELHEINKL